jgi:hypothetical protein
VKILTEKKPEYGNGVAAKLITIPGALALLSLTLSLVLPALIPVAAFFFLALVYFAYARYRFSRQGGYPIVTRLERGGPSKEMAGPCFLIKNPLN